MYKSITLGHKAGGSKDDGNSFEIPDFLTKHRCSHKILTQGIFYTLALLVVHILPFSLSAFVVAKSHVLAKSFVFNVALGIFAPLQGLFNVLIYIRPLSDNGQNKNSFTQLRTKKMFGFTSEKLESTLSAVFSSTQPSSTQPSSTLQQDQSSTLQQDQSSTQPSSTQPSSTLQQDRSKINNLAEEEKLEITRNDSSGHLINCSGNLPNRRQISITWEDFEQQIFYHNSLESSNNDDGDLEMPRDEIENNSI